MGCNCGKGTTTPMGSAPKPAPVPDTRPRPRPQGSAPEPTSGTTESFALTLPGGEKRVYGSKLERDAARVRLGQSLRETY